jgi:predicted RNA binding protein YcfA (HicA-like mRNA interferase family)
MESRTVIKLVEAVGWYEVGHEGSHKPFQHPTRRGKVTVPHPKKDRPCRPWLELRASTISPRSHAFYSVR